jgi:hypothetical protein
MFGARMGSYKKLMPHLICTALIASSINLLILFISIVLMAFMQDGQQWFVIIPLSIANGILLSNTIKNSEKIIITIIFTIIGSIIIYYLATTLFAIITPIHNIILYIFKDVSFEHFIGNFIGVMVFIIITSITLILLLLRNYTTKP